MTQIHCFQCWFNIYFMPVTLFFILTIEFKVEKTIKINEARQISYLFALFLQNFTEFINKGNSFSIPYILQNSIIFVFYFIVKNLSTHVLLILCYKCAYVAHVPPKKYVNLKSDVIQLFHYLTIQFIVMFVLKYTPYLTFSENGSFFKTLNQHYTEWLH